ncbi:hypothetical protein NDU88_000216 [Pleurodeles waltl]|uniref:Uncharacterized protein n=1 Tax=Pleurodeles waltl TaxID=8319 RepID=A0AAV7Q0K9_PLEWA|nr:hypothetical protein NDU88_000216 [Pleurodeles waltl]
MRGEESDAPTTRLFQKRLTGRREPSRVRQRPALPARTGPVGGEGSGGRQWDSGEATEEQRRREERSLRARADQGGGERRATRIASPAHG